MLGEHRALLGTCRRCRHDNDRRAGLACERQTRSSKNLAMPSRAIRGRELFTFDMFSEPPPLVGPQS